MASTRGTTPIRELFANASPLCRRTSRASARDGIVFGKPGPTGNDIEAAKAAYADDFIRKKFIF